MRNIPEGVRIATPLLAILLGWFAIDTILAEALSPKAQRFSQYVARDEPMSSGSLAEWAAAAALRGDLLADIAAALARGTAPQTPDAAAMRESALATAKLSLSLAPHSSATWLQLAMLQNRTQTDASGAAALKMSYLTSATDMNLIPTRLATLSRSAALGDGELRDLGRSDIRLILMRRPDMKAAIVSAYRGGSSDGKTYIDEVVRSIDPAFAASLH